MLPLWAIVEAFGVNLASRLCADPLVRERRYALIDRSTSTSEALSPRNSLAWPLQHHISFSLVLVPTMFFLPRLLV